MVLLQTIIFSAGDNVEIPCRADKDVAGEDVQVWLTVGRKPRVNVVIFAPNRAAADALVLAFKNCIPKREEKKP
jgi:hypothetical protein